MRETSQGVMALLLYPPPQEVFGGAMVLVALTISTIPGSLGRCEPVRGGLPPTRQQYRLLLWKVEGG
jgi:hypothetical protein